jgi:hypothetical protein
MHYPPMARTSSLPGIAFRGKQRLDRPPRAGDRPGLRLVTCGQRTQSCALRLQRTRPFPRALCGQRSTWFVADGVPGDREEGGHIDKRKQADVGCALRCEGRRTLRGLPLARWRVDPLSCCRTLFAEERLSPSARQGTPERDRQRVARARRKAQRCGAVALLHPPGLPYHCAIVRPER